MNKITKEAVEAALALVEFDEFGDRTKNSKEWNTVYNTIFRNYCKDGEDVDRAAARILGQAIRSGILVLKPISQG